MGIVDTYNYYMTDLADPRVKGWFLMDGLGQYFIITFGYLYFVLRCGPRFMKNRSAYNLLTFTKLYNLFQVFINAWIIYATFQANWHRDFGLTCQPFLYGTSPNDIQILTLTWLILVIKVVDYVETVVFVLRKKERQISFLHVYHHVTTAFIAWLFAKYYGDGNGMLIALVNCFVHVLMYTYYFLSTYGPDVQKAIAPFKRYLTIIQMVQFAILMMFAAQGFLPSCKINKVVTTIFEIDVAINFYLFYRFYQRNYGSKAKKT